MNSFSQNIQDLFAAKICKKKNGHFLDIGANHPINFNNTYLLESEFNWKGLMVEYLSNFEMDYINLRKNSKYIIKDARNINYKEFLEINNYPTNLDYLSIDLEVDNKSTLDVLELLDNTVFDKYKFATLTFEHDIYTGDYFNTRNIARDIFKKRGYILVFPDVLINWNNAYVPFEDWFIHPELIDINIINKIKTDKSLNIDEISELLNSI